MSWDAWSFVIGLLAIPTVCITILAIYFPFSERVVIFSDCSFCHEARVPFRREFTTRFAFQAWALDLGHYAVAFFSIRHRKAWQRHLDALPLNSSLRRMRVQSQAKWGWSR